MIGWLDAQYASSWAANTMMHIQLVEDLPVDEDSLTSYLGQGTDVVLTAPFT